MKKPKILTFALAAASLFITTEGARAANEFFNFNNGNMTGWRDLNGTERNTFRGDTVTLEFDGSRRTVIPQGHSLRAQRVRSLQFRGARLISRWSQQAGLVSSRVRFQPGGLFRRNTWAAWWVWTGQTSATDNNQQELDMVENLPAGNQFNHYWAAQQVGNSFTYPDSQSWMNSYSRYVSTFSTGRCVSFRRFVGSVRTQTRNNICGTARNRPLFGRYSQRPWPFSNNRFGGLRNYTNFEIDNAFRQF